MDKDGVRRLCGVLQPLMGGGSSLEIEKQVLIGLRFYAEGPYKKAVGQDMFNSVAQTTVSKYVHKVTDALCELEDVFIRFPTCAEERRRVSNE